jgi:hypothetical protein
MPFTFYNRIRRPVVVLTHRELKGPISADEDIIIPLASRLAINQTCREIQKTSANHAPGPVKEEGAAIR